MGPNSKDIVPIRDESFNEDQNQPAIVMGDEDDEEMMDVEENSHGYERLSTADNNMILESHADDSESSGSDEEDDDTNIQDIQAYLNNQPPPNVPEIISSDSEIQAEVWNASTTVDTIELNKEKTQQILSAMSKFTLPNIPSWAKEVNPAELIQRIKQQKNEKN